MNPTLPSNQLNSIHNSTSQQYTSTVIPDTLQVKTWNSETSKSANLKMKSRSIAENPKKLFTHQLQNSKEIESSEPILEARSTLSSPVDSDMPGFKPSSYANQVSKKLFLTNEEMQNKFLNFADIGDGKQLNKILIYFQHQFDINAHDFDGETALTKVVKLRTKKFEAKNPGAGRPDLAESLIYFGADLNKRNKAGDTPLIVATKAGHAKIVQLLLENGANAHLADFNKYTPLKWAAYFGRSAIVEELIYSRISSRIKSRAAQYEFSGKPYFKSGSDINACDEQVYPKRAKQVDEAFRFGLTGKVDPNESRAEIKMERALRFADEAWPRRISTRDMNDFEQALCIAKKQGHNWTVQVLRAHGVDEGDQIELDHSSDSSSSLV
jgi:ankyrin repeat protein